MRKIFLYTALALLPFSAWAAPVVNYVPNAQKVGGGTFSTLIWDVYVVRLDAPNGNYQPGQPFALTLTYLMDIEGADIAERSAEEIKDLGFNNLEILQNWQAQMTNIFPNVKEGDSLTGIYTKTGATKFYAGDKAIGTVEDPEFGKWFFDIWLSEKTPDPDLRAELLGR